MSNMDFDSYHLTLDDLVFLHSIKDKEYVIFSNASVRLTARGLLYEASAHNLKLTTRGHLACRGIFVGSTVQVTKSHHLRRWEGWTGIVVAIHDHKDDADGWDEYGYRLRRSKPVFSVDVKFPDRPGTYCFHHLDDLKSYFRANDGVKQNNVAWEYGKVVDSPQSRV